MSGPDSVEQATTRTRMTPGWLAVFLSLLFYILSGVIGLILLSPIIGNVRNQLASDTPTSSLPDQFALPDLAATLLGFTFATYILLFVWLRYYERRPLRALGLGQNGQRLFLHGWLLGLAATTAIASALVLWGGATVDFTANQAPLLPLIASLLILPFIWVVQAGSEELIFRGFLLQSLTHHRGFVVATILSSLIFSLMHFENGQPGLLFFTGYFALGVFLCLFTKIQNSLWGPIGFHAAWNFANLSLFGLTSTGASEDNPLFSLMARTPHLVTIEAGQDQMATAILGFSLICIIIFAVLRLRQSPLSSSRKTHDD